MMAAFPVGPASSRPRSAWLIMPTWGWRALFVVGVVPAVLLFFVRRYMPESVRYLLSRGGSTRPSARSAEIERQALGRRRAAAASRPADRAAADVADARRHRARSCSTPARRKRTILLWIVSFCFLWSSNGIMFMLPTILIQRGLPLDADPISFLLVQALAAIVGYTACGFLIDWYGRRPVLFLYYFVGAFFHLWFA